MNRKFKPRGFFKVPDGTEVSPFLNATDSNQADVPWGVLGDMSIAAGRIPPGVSSWIHIHPAVTQITYLVTGHLTIWMKDADVGKPYYQKLHPEEAVLSQPGTLFQLQNTSDEAASVLYIVSPSYVFEKIGGKILHDDSILVAKTWEELEASNYSLPGSVANTSPRRKEFIGCLHYAARA